MLYQTRTELALFWIMKSDTHTRAMGRVLDLVWVAALGIKHRVYYISTIHQGKFIISRLKNGRVSYNRA